VSFFVGRQQSRLMMRTIMDFMAWYLRAPLFSCTPQFILDMCAALRARQILIQICIGTVVYFTVRTVIRSSHQPASGLLQKLGGFSRFRIGVVVSHCPV